MSGRKGDNGDPTAGKSHGEGVPRLPHFEFPPKKPPAPSIKQRGQRELPTRSPGRPGAVYNYVGGLAFQFLTVGDSNDIAIVDSCNKGAWPVVRCGNLQPLMLPMILQGDT